MLKKISITLSLCITSGLGFAQKSGSTKQIGSFYLPPSKTSMVNIKLESDDDASVKNYILKNIPEYKTENSSVVQSYYKTSPGGKHYTYTQTYNNVAVYGASIKINTDNQKTIRSILNASYDVSVLNKAELESQISILNSKDFVTTFISKHFTKAVTHQNEVNICFIEKDKAIAVQKITVQNRNAGINELMLVNSNSEIIYKIDLKRYYASCVLPIDTVITAMVFNPDPLTTAHTAYAGAYVDNNDADNASLNNERVSKSIPATYNAGVFYLENAFVKITEVEAPTVAVVTSTTPNFNYTRSQSGFEDVNVFYHITTMQQYLQSLGYTNLMNQKLDADSHGVSGQDNSYFSGGSSPFISFGEGGVDDAEDADVITHEYGHAVSSSANNNNFVSNDRGALDEAFGDYQAATYSRNIDTYNWFNIFSWDGHNPFWPGRLANTTKVYPTDLINDIHDDGEIWSSAMMDIWAILGKTITDKLMYESLYNWSDNMSMPDAATLVIQADSLQNGGANYAVLCNCFKNHGLYNGNCSITGINELSSNGNSMQVLNSQGFASGTANLTLLMANSEKNMKVEITDVLGKNIRSFSVENNNRVVLSPDGLNEGIYIIQVKTATGNFSTKVIKY